MNLHIESQRVESIKLSSNVFSENLDVLEKLVGELVCQRQNESYEPRSRVGYN